MAEDLSFNPPVARRDMQFSLRGFIAGLMRFVGRAILAVAVGTFVVNTILGGLSGFLGVLLLLGTALIPWLANGVILVSWGTAFGRAEVTPRLPRALALLLYSAVNTLILFQIDDFSLQIDEFWGLLGLLGWTLLGGAAVASAIGGAAIAFMGPPAEAPTSGVAWRAWMLVVITATILGWIVVINWDYIEFFPSPTM